MGLFSPTVSTQATAATHGASAPSQCMYIHPRCFLQTASHSYHLLSAVCCVQDMEWSDERLQRPAGLVRY